MYNTAMYNACPVVSSAEEYPLCFRAIAREADKKRRREEEKKRRSLEDKKTRRTHTL
jgi:hypothetical protein